MNCRDKPEWHDTFGEMLCAHHAHKAERNNGDFQDFEDCNVNAYTVATASNWYGEDYASLWDRKEEEKIEEMLIRDSESN